MPLLDHFHPPLLGRRHWEGFHGQCASTISDSLNETLPADYFAEFQTSLGMRIEVDVAALREANSDERGGNGSAVALQTRTWAPPTPVAVIPAVFPDEFEVRIYSSAGTLVAAIELAAGSVEEAGEPKLPVNDPRSRLAGVCRIAA